MQKGVVRNFTKFAGKHLCQSLFSDNVAWCRCFPVNFVKFLRTPILQNNSGRLHDEFQKQLILNIEINLICFVTIVVYMRRCFTAMNFNLH